MPKRSAKAVHRRKSILVAGGAGFIGSHLCQRLIADEHHVYCLDNFRTGSMANIKRFEHEREFTLLEQNVRDKLPRSLRVDAIYNLACPASPVHYQSDPVGTLMTSVNGTWNLLELAHRARARFVQASTSEIYGDPERHPQREDYWGSVNPTGPRACYDEGKRAAETLCFDYSRMNIADVRVARIFNTYGPHMQIDDGRIVSNLVCQALSRRPLTIYGNGEQTRSFCYVDDLVRGLNALMAVRENPAGPVNLGNPDEFTINELASLVTRLLGIEAQVIHKPLPVDDPRRRQPDITRARMLLGWMPRIPLTMGLRSTIDWFSSILAGATLPERARSSEPIRPTIGAGQSRGI